MTYMIGSQQPQYAAEILAPACGALVDRGAVKDYKAIYHKPTGLVDIKLELPRRVRCELSECSGFTEEEFAELALDQQNEIKLLQLLREAIENVLLLRI